jgi:hypothetical protein
VKPLEELPDVLAGMLDWKARDWTGRRGTGLGRKLDFPAEVCYSKDNPWDGNGEAAQNLS